MHWKSSKRQGKNRVYMPMINAYHRVFGVVRVKIDAANKHGGICRRRRDDNLLGTTLQVS